MLVGLHVKNLALIEQADVEFGNGLNILTGETGAGKSIIIGSVALALGAKASRDMIRCGEEYAYIELIFSIDDEKKREELKKMDVYPDEDGLLIISKKITQTRSISRINDETVTTARLKAVTGKLLDIHGQHEHQSLLHKQKHLEILDEYSWRETGSLKRNVAESYRRYLELKGKLDGFSLDEESRKRELDFVRFEIDEIEDSALKPGEEEELAAKFRKFSHSQKIMERLQGAYQAVDGDAIGRAYREMESVASYDERLSGIAAGLSDAESILSDICRSISDYMDEMEFSGEDFKKTEERLDLVRGIMAKYGNSEEAVLKSLEEKKKRLEELENYEELAFAAKAEFEEQKLATLMTGEYDSSNAILTFHAGAGGTEAQDWVSMLLRMYMKWADRHGFKTEVLDILDGEEAGIKSASIHIQGFNAYGFLKSENGVHRLVRVSPFDAQGRRHTSFASVEVMPEIEKDVSVEIRDEDIIMEVFRASGAGGQHINKTSSAVRLIHKPTGIVVACQTQRSQVQNRDFAMKMLMSKLVEIKEREHLEKISDIKGEQLKIEWGSQIRSYVFMPYTLAKDTRTGFESGNIQAVMDGDIDGFIYAYLKAKSLGEI